eukprot:gene19626-20075_t
MGFLLAAEPHLSGCFNQAALALSGAWLLDRLSLQAGADYSAASAKLERPAASRTDFTMLWYP